MCLFHARTLLFLLRSFVPVCQGCFGSVVPCNCFLYVCRNVLLEFLIRDGTEFMNLGLQLYHLDSLLLLLLPLPGSFLEAHVLQVTREWLPACRQSHLSVHVPAGERLSRDQVLISQKMLVVLLGHVPILEVVTTSAKGRKSSPVLEQRAQYFTAQQDHPEMEEEYAGRAETKLPRSAPPRVVQIIHRDG